MPSNQEQIQEGLKTRGHYHLMNYKTKLQILSEFISFKENPPNLNGSYNPSKNSTDSQLESIMKTGKLSNLFALTIIRTNLF